MTGAVPEDPDALIEEEGGNRAVNLTRALELLRLARSQVAAESELIPYLHQQADILQRLADLEIRPREHLQEALSLRRQVRALSPPGGPALSAQMWEANVLDALAEHGVDPVANAQAAVSLYRDARTQYSDPPHRAWALASEAKTLTRLADLGVDPRANLEAALDLYRQAHPLLDDETERARYFLNESSAHAKLAAIDVDVEEHLHMAIALDRNARSLLTDPVEIAWTYLNESSHLLHLGLLRPDGMDVLHAAIGAAEEARARLGRTPAVAAALQNAAKAYGRLAEMGEDVPGNLERAMHLYAEVRAIYGSAPPDAAETEMGERPAETSGDPAGPTALLGEEADPLKRGQLLLEEGNTRQAMASVGVDPRANLERAMWAFSHARQLLPDPTDVGGLLINEANARQDLANLGVEEVQNRQEAISLYEQAERILHGPELGLCLMNHGSALRILAVRGVEPRTNYERAIEHAQRARTLVAHRRQLAQTLQNEANARAGLVGLGVEVAGNRDEALRLYAQAQDLFGRGEHHARSVASQAGLHMTLLAANVDWYENLREAKRLLGESAMEYRQYGYMARALDVYQQLGDLHDQSGELEEAQAAFAQAIDLLDVVRAGTGSVRDRSEWMERRSVLFGRTIDICLRRRAFADAMVYAERGRSRALADLLAETESAPPGLDADEAAEYRQLLRRIAQPEEEAVDSGSAAGDKRLDDQARTEERLRRFQRAIRAADPEHLAAAAPLDLAGIQSLAGTLERCLVLLSIGRRSVAFIVRPDGRWEMVPLPSAPAERVQAWALGTADEPGWVSSYLRSRGNPADRKLWVDEMAATLGEIYSWLMAPIHRALQRMNESRIALIVGGAAGLLPLHAASRSSGGEPRYLLDDLDVIFAPSAWVLDRCVRRDREGWSPVLAIANPATNDASRLRAAEWEVDQIKRRLARIGSAELTICAGGAATALEVGRLLETHPCAHFSCHAVWDSEDALHSALYLAGADRLTLADLFGHVDMRQSRLVVLSACESAGGYRPGATGEEYLGLPGGFIAAGSKAVIGSLWRVDDDATGLLMDRLYGNLLEDGMEIQDALRAAQRWLRELTWEELVALDWRYEYREDMRDHPARPFAHPVYWAAFQAYGAPIRLRG
jgi:CHAT domain-containing protein/TPR repeat protein